MNSKKIFYSCQEHIDIALDDFVDEFEVFPVLTKINNEKCSFCDKQAIYQVTNAD